MAMKQLDRFDTTAKKDVSIKISLVSLIFCFIIVCSVIATYVSLKVFDIRYTQNTEIDIGYTADGVYYIIQDWQENILRYTELLSEESTVSEVLENSDSSKANSFTADKTDKFGLDLFAIVNNRGSVLGGTGVKSGTDASSMYIVKKALKGSDASAFEGLGDIDFGIMSAVPVFGEDGRTILGCVICAYSLVDNEDSSFINIVRNNYNVECTVFKGKTRAMTTLGLNMVGTELTNNEIVQQVLTKGEEYKGENVISGEEYYSVYTPLKNDDGTSVGMLFVAKSMAVITKVRNQTLTIVIPIVAALIILFNVIMFMYIRWLMNRIKVVSDFLEELSSGDADLTRRAALYRRDEIGDLVIHFDAFLDKLQQIVKDVKISKNELSNSGTALSASMEDTSSAITEIIANIDSIHGHISNQTQGVKSSSKSVNEISAGIATLDSMIEDQSAGVAQASAAIEQMIGNISSVNTSVEKMSESFKLLQENAEVGFKKQLDVSEKIKQMEEQSKMLKDANTAILSIASQTNLLAMNAAIEAAHAGEAGKGFAVVADEIRKLSETSSSQSKAIGEGIKRIQETIGQVVSSSNESGAALSEVSNQISETDQLVIMIHSAMEEQNDGSKQITDALHNMNDSTVEVNKASKNMSEQKEKVVKEMNVLTNSTDLMKNGMDEIAVGAKAINETASTLSDISTKVSDAIEKIGAQIDLFKV